MLIVKSPVRISLFGGGTDIPEYFKTNGGMVISSAISQYFYLGIGGDIHASGYRLPETCLGNNQLHAIDDIKQRYMDIAWKQEGIVPCEISIECTVPIGSGLGTSSSIAAGILYGLRMSAGESIDSKEIAEAAINLERTIMKESGGWQDQIAIAYGGMNKIEFEDSGFQVEPVDISSDRIQKLQSSLMLFYTKTSRRFSMIHKDIHRNLDIPRLDHIYRLTHQAWDILNSEADLDQIGELLDESWAEKRLLGAYVTTSEIDTIYETAKNAGALGGKILGAGGGGHLLLYVPKPDQERVKCSLASLKYVPFQFVRTGPEIVYNDGK